MEPHVLDALPGAKIPYARWQEQEAGLRQLLQDAKKVAMQYSPRCAVPYVANVDAGTVELIRSLGRGGGQFGRVDPDLRGEVDARPVGDAPGSGPPGGPDPRARRSTSSSKPPAPGKPLDEYGVQQFVMRRFQECGLVTNHAPIVGANVNAADSHYSPPESGSAPIRRGDLVLLDLWAKLDEPDAVYYDITWMAFCGEEVPAPMREGVRGRRGRPRCRHPAGSGGRGRRPDPARLRGGRRGRAATSNPAAMAPCIRHRTGHSIGREVHGVGANMDNMETHDERPVIPWTCFSIEPALYLPDFGVRTEVNLFVEERGARVTGEMQTEFVKREGS